MPYQYQIDKLNCIYPRQLQIQDNEIDTFMFQNPERRLVVCGFIKIQISIVVIKARQLDPFALHDDPRSIECFYLSPGLKQFNDESYCRELSTTLTLVSTNTKPKCHLFYQRKLKNRYLVSLWID